MKIKKFIASDMSLLLNRVKEELGEDAVIISTSVLSDGKTELIAALDNFDDDFGDDGRQRENTLSYNDAFLRECLGYHQLTVQAQAVILSTCRRIAAERKYAADGDILTQAFEQLFHYGDFFDLSCPVKMFIGAHGSGKTTSLVKVATMARLRSIPVSIISTDTVRAGANSQLQAFASVLEVEYSLIRNHDVLFDKILAAQSDNRMVLIDTAGVNPFQSADIERLNAICNVVSCDKIITLDAGWNAEDAVEAVGVFAKLGAEWILPTKMDISRRIGAVLSTAATCRLQLGYAGIGSNIAKGLAKVNSSALTRLITE
uniref:Flagellar biosynthesis regulator FlhF n=1 Tax=uncultured Alphaproteobacteria bacterium TaxID=91750 RepID=A0A6G8F2Y6_9PROT|nr:flagellar biosynthesis regulator FlhF [uncultured Alphaproteobacteria bacterium]